METMDAAETGAGIDSLTTRGKARLAGFTLVVLAFVGLNVALTPPEVLLAAVTGWTDAAFGVHQVHDMVIAAVLWVLVIIPGLLLLSRPTKRVNTILAPIFVVPVAIMAFLAGSPLVMGFAISSVLVLLAVALHPAGRSLLALDRVERLDRRALAVYAVGAVPLVAYGLLELTKQFGPVDDHVLFVHFGAMTIFAGFVAIMGGLAIVRTRDWRFATWSTGVLAAFVGAVSIAYPGSASSLGVVGGGLLLGWALAFVALLETSRRSSGGTESDHARDRDAKPA